MLELKNISKRYNYKKILRNINMKFPNTGLIGIVGPSGCGKTTLLNIIGGIDKEFSGDLIYGGKSVKRKLDLYRRKHVSFIFQNNYLINWLSPSQNTFISRYFKSLHKGYTYCDEIEYTCEKVAHLSHGQRGKLSYLRAFFYDKDIVMADEPTGAMDQDNAVELMGHLKELSKERLIILVSHDLHLVKSYCDEVYSLKDGCIENHVVYNKQYATKRTKEKVRKTFFPLLRLSHFSLMAHKKSTMKMILCVFLSMICILCTLTLSINLKDSIYNYIYALLPSSSISVLSHDIIDKPLHNSITSDKNVKRFHLFLDECELLGVGFDKTRYKYSSTLFIHDDSSPYEDVSLKLGEYPKNNNDILISLSTAKHLLNEDELDRLINKKIYAWYKIYDSCVSIEYNISGITSFNTQSDVIYQKENAYISLLENKGIDVKSSYGLIYLSDNIEREEFIKGLKYKYKDMEFKASGQATLDKAENIFDKVETVLFLFTSLIIISSFVLIGEVSFLNVVLKRKDFAIMKCFGASGYDLIKIVILESLEIITIASILVISCYYTFLYSINIILNHFTMSESIMISGSLMHVGAVIICGVLLMIISQLISVFYIIKLNTQEALKS